MHLFFISRVKETECKQSKPDLQDLMKSYTASSSSHEEVNLNGNAEKNENNMQDKSNESISLKEIQDWNSALEVSKSSSIESVSFRVCKDSVLVLHRFLVVFKFFILYIISRYSIP